MVQPQRFLYWGLVNVVQLLISLHSQPQNGFDWLQMSQSADEGSPTPDHHEILPERMPRVEDVLHG